MRNIILNQLKKTDVIKYKVNNDLTKLEKDIIKMSNEI